MLKELAMHDFEIASKAASREDAKTVQCLGHALLQECWGDGSLPLFLTNLTSDSPWPSHTLTSSGGAELPRLKFSLLQCLLSVGLSRHSERRRPMSGRRPRPMVGAIASLEAPILYPGCLVLTLDSFLSKQLDRSQEIRVNGEQATTLSPTLGLLGSFSSIAKEMSTSQLVLGSCSALEVPMPLCSLWAFSLG